MAKIIEQINIGGEVYDIASTIYVTDSQTTASKVVNIEGFHLISGVTIRVKFTHAQTTGNPTLTVTGGDNAANTAINISGIATWPAGAILTLTYDGTSWVYQGGYGISGSGTNGYLAKFNGDNSITSGPQLGSGTVKFLREDGTWQTPPQTEDTHYTATLAVGNANTDTASEAVSASTTGVRVNIVENGSVNTSLQFAGAGGITIGSTAAGKITFTGKAGTVTKIIPGNGLINGTSGTSQAEITGEGTISIKEGGVTNAMLANNSITIGSVTKELGQSFTLADLGIAAAMNFKGTTTTELTDGATTSPISIGGSNYTPTNGDVVLYSGKEFVWTGTAWEELGDESSWALSSEVIHNSLLTTKGDIIYRGDSAPARLGIGTSGQVLTVSSTGIPTWSTPSVSWSNVDGKPTAALYINKTSTGATSNVATTNTDTYLHLYYNSQLSGTVKFTGSGGTSVTADNSKVITISSKEYESSGSISAITKLYLMYNNTASTAAEMTATANTSAVALGFVDNATLYIKSIYKTANNASTGVQQKTS